MSGRIETPGTDKQLREEAMWEARRLVTENARLLSAPPLSDASIENLMLEIGIHLWNKNKDRNTASARLAGLMLMMVFCRRQGLDFRDVDELAVAFAKHGAQTRTKDRMRRTSAEEIEKSKPAKKPKRGEHGLNLPG